MRIGVVIIVCGVVLTGQVPGDHPIKCGWGVHPHLMQARIAAVQLQPDRHMTYISPDGAFAVHYDTTARGDVDHSPPLKPAQPDGTPDWVVKVAAALSWSRYILVDSLGYAPAPLDDDSIFDVYLQENDGGLYGETVYRDRDTYQLIPPYIEMDNDFAKDENYYTHGIDAARITVAHEYFHAVQLSYRYPNSDGFFYELSSTWFEDVAYPEVNDWVPWFDTNVRGYTAIANDPEQPMSWTSGYDLAVFGHYLTATFGDMDIMRQIWARFKLTGATNAIEERVMAHGSNLTCAWTDFIAKLFFNGRAPQLYFHADQDSLAPPEYKGVLTLIGDVSLPFDNLRPGTAGIQALNLARPANLRLQVWTAPETYSARLVLNEGGYSLHNLTNVPWYAAGLSSLTEMVLVVGGEQGSVVVAATAKDTLTNLAFTLEYMAPNPLILSHPAHREITLGYTVGKALPEGDHRIVIYNLLGQEIYHQQITRTIGEGSQTLHLSTLPFLAWPSGVYILRLTVAQRHTFTRTFTILR